MTLPDKDPHQPPDVLASVREDLADWRAWVSRGVILAYAAAAGISVVAFTRLCELALSGFGVVRGWNPWAPFLWTPAVCAALALVTVRHFPGASGSGIPQVIAALHTSVDD